MTINASARNYYLTVNGVDCTSLLSSFDGGYSHYESGSGLSLINASLVLNQNLDSNINLDDRTSNNWVRGNVIRVLLANSTQQLSPAPVIGFLYILNAEFDGRATLKIEAGCILNLLNFRTPAGSGIYFKLGNLIDLNSIASALLVKAGVPSFSVNVTGSPLKAPVPKLTNESYIQFFGKLCWANGFIAYQDNLGIVKTKSVSFSVSPSFVLSLGKHDIKCERLTGAEHPCEKIIVSGTISSVKEKQIPLPTITEKFGSIPGSINQGLVERTIYSEDIDSFARKITTTTESHRPAMIALQGLSESTALIIAEIKTEIKQYELNPAGNQSTTGLIDSIDPDEGRLIKSITTTTKPVGVVLSEFIANVGASNFSTPLTQLIDEGTEEVIYSYPPDLPDTEPLPGSITVLSATQHLAISTKKYQPKGIIYDDPPNSNPLFSPFDKVLIEDSTQSWIKKSEDEWQSRVSTFKSLGTNPSALDSFEEYFGYPPSEATIFGLVSDELVISNGKSDQIQPPSPDRWSSGYSLKEKSIKATELFTPLVGNVYREREREYVVESFLTSKEQAREIAKNEGAFLYGRYKGVQCSIALRDELFTASPLFRMDWIDLSGTSQAYLVDGLSVALTTTRFAVSFDGVWLGTGVAGGGIIPPYQIVSEFAGGSGDGGTLRVVPYSLAATQIPLTGGIGDGGLLLAAALIPLRGGSGDGGKIDATALVVHLLSIGTGSGGAIESLTGERISVLDNGNEFLLDNGEYLILD